MNTQTNALTDVAAVVGRLLLAAIFLISGFSKLANPAGTIGYIASSGLPLPEVAYAGAVFIEVFLAAALVLGYRTRLVAAAIAGFTLVTAFAFHFNLGDQNQFIHFFKNIAIAGGLLQVIALGGGKFSLDARRTA